MLLCFLVFSWLCLVLRKITIAGPFRRGMLSHGHALTHAQKYLEVWSITGGNQTFYYTFLLLSCLCLIKVCVSIFYANCLCYDYAEGCGWLLNWSYINKYFDSESFKKSERCSSQSILKLEWMKKFVALLKKEKWLRMTGEMVTLTFLKLYTVYSKN